MTAEELIRGGNLEEALAGVQADVRKKPADAKLRVLLFQLLAILGQSPLTKVRRYQRALDGTLRSLDLFETDIPPLRHAVSKKFQF